MNIKLKKEQRDEMKDKIQSYFYTERGEEIGELAAENALVFFIEELSPIIYNQGIKDAKNMVEQRMIALEEDIASLEISPPLRKRK